MVMKDDHDGSPYSLKKLGTTAVRQYFTQADVQKVTRGGGPVRLLHSQHGTMLGFTSMEPAS